MHKKQKLTFDIVNFALGILLIFALMAVVYSHLWISSFESTPGSELLTIFSEDVANEKEAMENLRVFAGLGTLVLFSLTAVAVNKYYELHDDPEWEMKKGLGAGLVLFLAGGVFYLMLNLDLMLEAISLALLISGTVFVMGNAIYLLMVD